MAQSTVVSCTVIDSAGQVWENGYISYTFQPNADYTGAYLWGGTLLPAQYLSATIVQLDGSGYASFSLPSSSDITPANSRWRVTVCPDATAPCITLSFFITGSTQDISSAITSALLELSIQVQPIPKAYSDEEILTVINHGGIYYNTTSNVLRVWDGTQFQSIESGGASGNATSIQGVPVDATTPVNEDVLIYSSVTATYNVRQLTADDILPGFTINSFTGGSTVEIGTPIVNPSFAASYSSTPASAFITNTDGIDSPLTLTSPFTAGTVAGTFTKNTAATTTFTLNATKGVSRTSTQVIASEPRVFAGVGATGATSTVTATGNNATLSTGDVLASAGISASQVGQTFGPFSPTGGTYIYILIIGTGHTFTDTISGFAFPMNTPIAVTFTNQHGDAVAMQLYKSVSSFSGGTYAPKAVS